MSTTRRFYLPSWSPALVAVRRRCASVTMMAKRYPLTGTGAEPGVSARARVESSRGRYRTSVRSTLTLEITVADGAVRDERVVDGETRYDLQIATGPGALAAWLAALSRDYAPDEFAVSRGTWGVASLVLEDRGPDRVLVDVRDVVRIPGVPSPWQVPPEWEGAVEVTGDPAWLRAVLTRATWPVVAFRPLGPRPPLDAAPGKCEGRDMTFFVMNASTCGLDEWRDQAISWEGKSAPEVARDCAATWIEEPVDGTVTDVIVAAEADGSDAKRYAVKLTVRHCFDVTTEERVIVQSPGSGDA